MNRSVSLVQYVEITAATAWMIEGQLWRFRHGATLSVGEVSDLAAAEPVITPAIALALINAGKAEAMDTVEIGWGDAGDLELYELEAVDVDREEAA